MRWITCILIALSCLLWIAGCRNSETSSPPVATTTVAIEKTAAEGTLLAETDIAAGLLVNWQLPLPSPPWAGLLQQACVERGITLKSDSVEVVKSAYITAYNKRMTEEIIRRYGVDVAELDHQAYLEYEKRRKKRQ
jgi:hypothetical protein